MKAVGEDTGKNMIGLLDMSPEQIKAIGDASQVSAADLKQAAESSRSYAVAVAGIGRVWREVVAAVAPSIQQFSAWTSKAVGPIAELVRANRELIVGTLGVGVALVVAGAALVGFGAAFKGGAAAVGIVSFALKAVLFTLGALTSPIGLVTAALVGLGYAFLTQTDTGKKVLAELGSAFKDLKIIAGEAWEGIAADIAKGDLVHAFKVVGAGINAVWARAMLALRRGWNDTMTWIVDTLKKNPWILPLIGALGGAAVGGVVGAGAGAAGGAAGALAIELYADEIKKDLSVQTDKAEAAVAKARAELAGLVAEAKAPAAAPEAFVSPGAAAAAARAGTLTGSRGSFTAANAAQRFGASAGGIAEKQLKVAEEQMKVMKAGVMAIENVAKGLRFK